MVVASAINDLLRGLSVGLQLIGIALLLLGVADVRSWLDRTADASQAVRRTLVRRLELQVENVRHGYATLRGRPFHTARHVSDTITITISDSATATMTRARAHPEGLSDHERLIRVETRAYGVQLQVDQLQKERADDQRKLHPQRDQLRAEIREATRAGWQFIIVGLVTSAVGIVLGAFSQLVSVRSRPDRATRSDRRRGRVAPGVPPGRSDDRRRAAGGRDTAWSWSLAYSTITRTTGYLR